MTFERYAARRSQDFADLIADLEPGIARKGGLRMTSLGASDASTKDKRAVPLRRELVDALRELKPKGVLPTRPVFWYAWPTYDILCSDFKRPGIERVDGLGRVLHFHSFRKTWQAFGVRFGVNQRAAQEIPWVLRPQFDSQRLHRCTGTFSALGDSEIALDNRGRGAFGIGVTFGVTKTRRFSL